jgi:hypothetical protein
MKKNKNKRFRFCTNTAESAKKGHLDCIKYAYEKGYEWHPDTILAAISNNQIECMKYAIEHGCPLHPRSAYFAAAIGSRQEILKYIYEMRDK